MVCCAWTHGTHISTHTSTRSPDPVERRPPIGKSGNAATSSSSYSSPSQSHGVSSRGIRTTDSGVPVVTTASPATPHTVLKTTLTHRGLGCASPEVLVNGSPSPDILETVNGATGGGVAGSSQQSSGSSAASSLLPGAHPSAGNSGGIGNIQEIQFVGSSITVTEETMVQDDNSTSGSRRTSVQREKRRICRIKCLNGVWVGPLCLIESGKQTAGSSYV